MLDIVDDVTRECLRAVVDTSISGRRVVRELADLIAGRGAPKMIVSDNGTERPHSSPGDATPAAFAAGLDKQRAGLTPPVASPARVRDNTNRSLVAAG